MTGQPAQPPTMRPGDVPDDLVADAVDAWHEAPRPELLLDDLMRHILAAVIPAIRAAHAVDCVAARAHYADLGITAPGGWALRCRTCKRALIAHSGADEFDFDRLDVLAMRHQCIGGDQ